MLKKVLLFSSIGIILVLVGFFFFHERENPEYMNFPEEHFISVSTARNSNTFLQPVGTDDFKMDFDNGIITNIMFFGQITTKTTIYWYENHNYRVTIPFFG
jgi:hypothetical protein